MKKIRLESILTAAVVLLLTVVCLTGCGQSGEAADASNQTEVVNAGTEAVNTETTNTETEIVKSQNGGIIYVRVNPEFAVIYDENGIVTRIEAINKDAKQILKNLSGYKGKKCRKVIKKLVKAIGKAGYLVEEIEGGNKQITIEIENGSQLPTEKFLDGIVSAVRKCVSKNSWKSPVEVEGESDYGISDYIDTDYGPENDGDTDYDDTDYGPNNDGDTDYDDTDYGPNNDGVTDYDDTDYGPNNDGVTDYDDTDYGPNNDGDTDYDDTDYGPNNDGVTDYDDTDYGPNNDGVTDYDDTDYGPNNDGVTDYDDSDDDTDYDDTDYDSDDDTDYDD